MKLMCVNNLSLEEGYIPPITIGKVYETEPFLSNYISSVWESDSNYCIVNDLGFGSWELIENFIPLEEWREKQLDKLL